MFQPTTITGLEENKKSTLLPREDNNTASDDADNSSYEYKYHYIIHYDRELYKQDKKTQGKVKCGPFTESQIRTFF